MKELLRCLIDYVVLTRIAADEVEARIAWTSGGCWSVSVLKTIHTFSDSSKYKIIVARIRTLWQEGMSDQDIAKQLTSEGFRSSRATTFLKHTVLQIRMKLGWKRSKGHRKKIIAPIGYLTINELTSKLGIHASSLYRYVLKGIIPQSCIMVEKGAFLIKDCDRVFNCINRYKSQRTS